MKLARTYSRPTIDATQLLGARVRLARRERRWTIQELADRVGVARATMQKVERGDPTVRLGAAFEAATVVGVPLFTADRTRLSLEARHVDDRLALLPQRTRKPTKVDDDF